MVPSSPTLCHEKLTNARESQGLLFLCPSRLNILERVSWEEVKINYPMGEPSVSQKTGLLLSGKKGKKRSSSPVFLLFALRLPSHSIFHAALS